MPLSLGQLASTRAVGVGRQSRSAEEELRLAAANEVGVGYGCPRDVASRFFAAMAMGRRPKAIPPGFSSCIISGHP